jgi:hypothetical protein
VVACKLKAEKRGNSTCESQDRNAKDECFLQTCHESSESSWGRGANRRASPRASSRRPTVGLTVFPTPTGVLQANAAHDITLQMCVKQITVGTSTATYDRTKCGNSTDRVYNPEINQDSGKLWIILRTLSRLMDVLTNRQFAPYAEMPT